MAVNNGIDSQQALDPSASPEFTDLTLSNSTEHGVVVGGAANALTYTAVGSAGEALTSNGAGNDPTFQAIPDSGVQSVTGTADRITIGGTAADPTVDIASTYVGQTSITTLGTVATGTWEATDVAVAHGGTGASTLTGVLTGNGTSAITANAVTEFTVLLGDASNAVTNVSGVGTATQVLTSNGAGMAPTFQDATGGSGDVVGPGPTVTDNAVATFDGTGGLTIQESPIIVDGSGNMSGVGTFSASGDATIERAAAGSLVTATSSNSDNTNSNSDARLRASVGGASGGDPYLSLAVAGVTGYGVGVDNSDSDKLKIKTGGNFDGNDLWISTSAGEITMPLQPSFLAYLNTDADDKTGNGSVYKVGFNAEIYDQGSDYDTTGFQFTSPVTGRYFLNTILQMHDITAAGTNGLVQFFVSNRTNIYAIRQDFGNMFVGGVGLAVNASFDADMDAGDVAYVNCVVTGEGADNVDFNGTTDPRCWFSGRLCE